MAKMPPNYNSGYRPERATRPRKGRQALGTIQTIRRGYNEVVGAIKRLFFVNGLTEVTWWEWLLVTAFLVMILIALLRK